MALSAAVLALLSACSGSGRPKPTPLEDFKPSRSAQVVWSAKVGAAQGTLSLATSDGQVHMASADGTLVSLDPSTGKERWRADYLIGCDGGTNATSGGTARADPGRAARRLRRSR